MNKLLVLVSGAIGYVLGSRAGRDRYEQIRSTAAKVKNDPRVQSKATHAADLAREKAPLVKEKMTSAAGAVAHKVTPGSSNGVESPLTPDNLAQQDSGYPQGDVP